MPRTHIITLLLLVLTQPLPGVTSGNISQSGPQIMLSATELHNFREVYTGRFSDLQFYDVSAQGLTHDLLLTAEQPFAISLHCHDDFGQTITIKPTNGLVATTRVFVRYFPSVTGQHSTTISHSTEGGAPLTVTASGTATENRTPTDYYSTATGGGSTLKTQLHHITANHQTQTYSSLWSHFITTDATFSGKVWDIYSDIPCEPPPYLYAFGEDQDPGLGGGSEGQYYNREHSMPRSWFSGDDPMNTDLYHIYPVDKRVNAIRDNFPLGEVNNPTTTTMNGSKLGNNSRTGYSGTAFEPIDAYKGDLARTFFYMITRYEDRIESWTNSPEAMAMLDNKTYPGYKEWAIDMLVDWHELDPVSQKEISRNNAVYQIQGNRNPFVDHPEFVQRIWGDTTTITNELTNHSAYALFPNPANDYFIIDGPKEHFKVSLSSSHGNTIFSQKNAYPGNPINLPPLKPGPYIVKIESDLRITHHILILHNY